MSCNNSYIVVLDVLKYLNRICSNHLVEMYCKQDTDSTVDAICRWKGQTAYTHLTLLHGVHRVNNVWMRRNEIESLMEENGGVYMHYGGDDA